jgi:AcrR family transcriptional regulator
MKALPVKNKTKKAIQSEKTVKEILDKSILLFGTRGYHLTTMSDIAQYVGVTKGGLYCHFRSKEELFTRVVGEVEKRFLNSLFNYVDELDGNVIEKLVGAIKFNAQYMLKNKEIVIFLLTLSSEVINVHSGFEKILKGLYDKYRKFISNLIERGKQEGSIREDIDSDLMALFFIGSHDGILLQWSLNHNALKGTEITKTLIKLIAKGFSK